MDTVEVLDRLLGVSLLMQRDQDRFVGERGTTPARVHLLWLLGEDGPSRQQHLARRLEVSPRNVTGLVDGLVADGLVTREPDATDRRAVLVTPTAQGRTFVDELQQGRTEFARLLLGDVAPGELEVVDRVLGRVEARLVGLATAEETSAAPGD